MNRCFSLSFISRQLRNSSLVALGLAMSAGQLHAADIVVNSTADTGAGSLRAALGTAVSGDRIVFDLPGTPTIQLQSALPPVAADVSFFNLNANDVVIDRNTFGPLTFTGTQVDPTTLILNTSGAPSLDADIVTGPTTALIGNGPVTGNLQVPGILSPGSTSALGNLGTLNVTGNLDATAGTLQLDLSTVGGTPASDLITVTGTATITDATLAPRFSGDQFAIGQEFVVIDSANPLVGTLSNAGTAFALPNNPFLEAIINPLSPATQLSLSIQDNGASFTTLVSGCNQTSAANLLDRLAASATPPSGVLALRNGSGDNVSLAIDQLSGSIYPSLIGAEINHVQTGLESVRTMIIRQVGSRTVGLSPWIRGYGITGEVDEDDCQTKGYRHEVGGLEMGCGLATGYGLTGHLFSHLAWGSLNTRGVDQKADIASYRLGGSLAYVLQDVYVLAAGGAGVQDYDVRRSLSAFEGSTFVESSFDGSSQFGYFEVAYAEPFTPYLAMHATRVELDPIQETGDDDFALANLGGSGNSLRSVLGISLFKSSPTSFGMATTRLRFGWLHEYLDESELFVSQIAAGSSSGDLLVDRGVSAGRDWGFVRTQVDMGMFMGGALSVAYEGQYNAESSFNWLLLGWVY